MQHNAPKARPNESYLAIVSLAVMYVCKRGLLDEAAPKDKRLEHSEIGAH